MISFMIFLGSSKGMSVLESAELNMFATSEGISRITQTVQPSFYRPILLLLYC
jgi:hypothetical protein